MDATFVFTNAAPQFPTMNRGVWAQIEAEVRSIAATSSVWVVTAVAFNGPTGPLTVARIGKHQVWVPTHFTKSIVVADSSGTPCRAKAWAVPNIDTSGTGSDKFLVTVDDVEQLTGLDLFPNLPDDIEHKIESVIE